ncbi:MAG: DUF378 domain-containing protein [Candidatus Nanohaloarchaea archaeon]|nr:DUF378 domain-containing protein [Candidatus Nanohaloarchaea archaeon]
MANAGSEESALGKLAFWLVIIGALNWGLYGLHLFGTSHIDVVDLILGSVPWLQDIVYLLVGLSGIYLIFAGE